jgi:hypothetical protein
LTGIASQILKVVDSPEVLLAWTEFLCSTDLYFDDAYSKLVGPVCQVLIQRIREDVSTQNRNHEEDGFTVAIMTAITDIMVRASFSDSGKIATPALSIQGTKAKSTWAGGLPRHPSFDKGMVELRLNLVTSLIPFLFVEICHLGNQLSSTEARQNSRLMLLCERIYLSNPSTTLYSVIDHIGGRIEVLSDTKFIVDTPLERLFNTSTGPFREDLMKNLSIFMRGIRDAKNDPYSKLYCNL